MPSFSSLTETQLAVLAALALLLLVLLVGLVRAAFIRRHARLRSKFGPEYDRVVEEYGNPKLAERALRKRERRVKALHLRRLSERTRAGLSAEWQRVELAFIDDPAAAIIRADELVKAAMAARGYEPEPFDDRVADLSVEHADVVQHYRAARALTQNMRDGGKDTEELRQALVHYRTLFSALVERPAEVARHLKEAHV